MNICLKHGIKLYPPDVYGLRACDLEVRTGEFLVVMGPSGCGKSTLLKVLAGVAPLDAGELYLDGIPAENIPQGQRDVSMVFQEYVLYPNKSVYENILAGVKFSRVPYEQAIARAEYAMALFDLVSVRDQRPKSLSGGQQQRTALAKALVKGSRLVLMDEPMSNVSEEARAEYCRLLACLKREMPQASFVYVTHNPAEAMQLADRIAFMDDGRVLEVVKKNLLAEKKLEFPEMLLQDPALQNSLWLPCSLEAGEIRILEHSVPLGQELTGRLLRLPARARVRLQTEKLSKTPLLQGIPLDLTVEENMGSGLWLRAGEVRFCLHKRTRLEPGMRIRMYYDLRQLEIWDEFGPVTAWYSLGGNVFPAQLLGRGAAPVDCRQVFVPYDAITLAKGGEACVLRAERCLQEQDMEDFVLGYFSVKGVVGQVAARLPAGTPAMTLQKPRLALDLSRAISLK